MIRESDLVKYLAARILSVGGVSSERLELRLLAAQFELLAVVDERVWLLRRLRVVEAKFRGSGGRGVELAEEIDRLREKLGDSE